MVTWACCAQQLGHLPWQNPQIHPFRSDLPQALCVTKAETMKFVNVVRSDGAKPGSSFTIATHGGDGDIWSGGVVWQSKLMTSLGPWR
ncbi:hypothetical protein C2845_PM06G19380 [Panicum miliaceum]|uniref:Uncharacterized protein n=1 Tax=Panicum miliaceum TaxID=4540 RepID=A0A3L6R6L0_PANMI|nr:hypothetical protein C2845_PM06G19380 [Panicum miliaceum]